MPMSNMLSDVVQSAAQVISRPFASFFEKTGSGMVRTDRHRYQHLLVCWTAAVKGYVSPPLHRQSRSVRYRHFLVVVPCHTQFQLDHETYWAIGS